MRMNDLLQEEHMKKPAMIIFDYGHTLLYEPDIDFLRGEKAVFSYITENPHGITPEQAAALGTRLFAEAQACRQNGFELHEWPLLRLKYEALGLKFSLPLPELEQLLWAHVSPGAVMPGAAEMLAALQSMGIRTGVISNLGWSGQALSARIGQLLPGNTFEFIITSSDYGIRKPNPLIFKLALQKAGLEAEQAWYCGDSLAADVMGAHAAGLFPVLYEEKTIENPYADGGDIKMPSFPCLHIRSWAEMVERLNICHSHQKG